MRQRSRFKSEEPADNSKATGVNGGRGPSVPPALLPQQEDRKADAQRPAVNSTCDLQRNYK